MNTISHKWTLNLKWWHPLVAALSDFLRATVANAIEIVPHCWNCYSIISGWKFMTDKLQCDTRDCICIDHRIVSGGRRRNSWMYDDNTENYCNACHQWRFVLCCCCFFFIAAPELYHKSHWNSKSIVTLINFCVFGIQSSVSILLSVAGLTSFTSYSCLNEYSLNQRGATSGCWFASVRLNIHVSWSMISWR